MITIMKRLFADHPASVEESYFEHMRFAAWFASQLWLAGGAALVHAIVPGLCQKTASTIITRLHNRIHNRG
jgi:hypothetical protein